MLSTYLKPKLGMKLSRVDMIDIVDNDNDNLIKLLIKNGLINLSHKEIHQQRNEALRLKNSVFKIIHEDLDNICNANDVEEQKIKTRVSIMKGIKMYCIMISIIENWKEHQNNPDLETILRVFDFADDIPIGADMKIIATHGFIKAFSLDSIRVVLGDTHKDSWMDKYQSAYLSYAKISIKLCIMEHNNDVGTRFGKIINHVECLGCYIDDYLYPLLVKGKNPSLTHEQYVNTIKNR